MIFLILGLIFTVCKWQEIGPIAAWSWWTVLAPYALAVLWWAWADYSGYTKNVEVKKWHCASRNALTVTKKP